MRVLKGRVLALCVGMAAYAGAWIEPAWAGDAAAGRAVARVTCRACHGEDGKAVLLGAANLSGQEKEYLVAQLRAYRSGSRRHEQMSVIAKSLSDGDIDNVAEWYSSIKVTIEMPK